MWVRSKDRIESINLANNRNVNVNGAFGSGPNYKQPFCLCQAINLLNGRKRFIGSRRRYPHRTAQELHNSVGDRNLQRRRGWDYYSFLEIGLADVELEHFQNQSRPERARASERHKTSSRKRGSVTEEVPGQDFLEQS